MAVKTPNVCRPPEATFCNARCTVSDPFVGVIWCARSLATHVSVSETGDLPSAEALPSVFYRALGKYRVCRVPNKIHSANKNTRQNTSLPSVFFLALGKDVFCRVYFLAHGKIRLCRVFFSGTRQRGFLPCAFFFGPRQISFSKQFLRP